MKIIKENWIWLGLVLFSLVGWTIIGSVNTSTKNDLVNESIDSKINEELGISISDIEILESKKENANYENIYGYLEFYNKHFKKFKFQGNYYEARITIGSNGGIENLELVDSELWIFNKEDDAWYEIQDGNLYDIGGNYYTLFDKKEILSASAKINMDNSHKVENIDKDKDSQKIQNNKKEEIKKETNLERIKQKSRFNFPIKDDVNTVYNLYIYTDDETESNDKDTWAGSTGEIVYTGYYKIALQKQGDKEVQLQEMKIGKKFFNMNRNMVFVADGHQDLLVVSQFGSSNNNMAEYFYIKEEKLVRVPINNIEEGGLNTGTKYLEPNVFQKISYSNSGPVGWLVTNHELDYVTGNMVELSSKWFVDNEWNLGEEHYNRFVSENSYVISIEPL